MKDSLFVDQIFILPHKNGSKNAAHSSAKWKDSGRRITLPCNYFIKYFLSNQELLSGKIWRGKVFRNEENKS